MEIDASRKRTRDASDLALLLRGTVVDAPSLATLRILSHAVLGVDTNGRISFLEDGHDEPLTASDTLHLRDGGSVALRHAQIRMLPPRGFVCPGFVDTHTHAPQFSFAGIGYDLQLLDWLNKYTFPSETKFGDSKFAARVCHNAVSRTLRAGTTTCMYFATIHTDAAIQLGRIAAGLGQRALVGKVNMDRNAPDFYIESTEESLAETERFVAALLAEKHSASRMGAWVGDGGTCAECEPLGPPPEPVITPRFVPTCTSELMRGLADIAKRHQLRITSHVSENMGEIAWVR